MQKSRVALPAVLGVLALLLAACGGKAKQASSEDPYGQSQATTGQPAASAAALKLTQSQLGPILTDGNGRTLYGFLSDQGGTSTCYAQCAQSWPPLVTQGNPTPAQGVDAALLGLTPRNDGTQQVTYKKWPLYYFAGDQGQGQTKGQGLKGMWYVVGSSGLVKGPAAQAQGQGYPATGQATWVKLAQSAQYGPILTDAKGRTLYALGLDKGGIPHCYLQCAASWPPLVSTGDVKAGTGLNQSMFAVKARPDGKRQVIFNNWPLYYYAGDQAAGQTRGQAMRGIWWLIGPSGLVKAQAQAPATTSAGGGGYGYGGYGG